MLIGGEKKMKLDDLDSEQMLKVKQTWKSFRNIWIEGEPRGMKFVAEHLATEVGVNFEVAFSILSEYEKDILKRERNNITIEAVERDTKASFTESIEVDNQKVNTRQELVDILLRIKYAQERHVFYDEVLDIESIPLDKVKIAHPRLHQLAIKEAENMMAGIDEQDASALLKTFNKGLVKDILDCLEMNGAMSATGVLRALGKKYANWHQRISNVLQWLVSQNLVYRVGAKRYAFSGYAEVEGVGNLGAMESRILDEIPKEGYMTTSKLHRLLGGVNHKSRRDEINEAISNLIEKGYIEQGIYRRLSKVLV